MNDKSNNNLAISLNSKADGHDKKYKINHVGKITTYNKILENNEKDFSIRNKNGKKNYSESPTIKRSFLVTDYTNIENISKSNANLYKRNNSTNNVNTSTNINQINQFNEESIELIIPTPYPKNVIKIF